MQFYVLNKYGRIINAIQAPNKKHAEQFVAPGYTLKTEDEIPIGTLERYQYWDERP